MNIFRFWGKPQEEEPATKTNTVKKAEGWRELHTFVTGQFVESNKGDGVLFVANAGTKTYGISVIDGDGKNLNDATPSKEGELYRLLPPGTTITIGDQVEA